jgi:hypothetical protein
MAKIVKPLNPLIFKVAGELAATWYEIGRSQGLKSKWKTPKQYAYNNLEKFVPKAIEHLLDILSNPSFPDLAKAEIYEALIDPINDKDLMDGTSQLDNIQAKKLDEIVKEYEKRKLPEIVTEDHKKTVLHNNVKPKSKNPFLQRPN